MGLRPLAYWDCGFESRRGRGVCLLGVLFVRWRSLRWAGNSSRWVLPSAVRPSVIEEPRRGSLGPLGLSSHDREREKKLIHVRTVFLVYQVLDFPIKTFVCFLVDKHFVMNSDRDTSKLLLLIYHVLYFTLTSLDTSEFSQCQKRSSFNAFFLRIFLYAPFQSLR